LQRLRQAADRGSGGPDVRPPDRDRSDVTITRRADIPALVEEAYLRTVSRIPSDDEQAIAAEYVAQAENPIAGLRDLMWSLLNTKEFIVNH
jgi:hypothetical protein